ncbi:probable DNA double-strand break repair Rad50 ATPase isoform X1 [Polypterus senegalus]|uniref:probable DNA double-strand break repair Rad50 ATPase isoform X1 n=1 Tax=Polypterus senegalus TaxID=55291 RepID=UPI001963E7BD|nr:probable DNA double-strand break repair Rad50 ATPase isoform X1 [Polypterus senegalus]
MMWLCELVFSALHDHLWRLFAFLFGVENTKHPPQVTAPIDIRSIETLSAPLMAVPLEMESILTVGLFTLWVSMAGLFLYTSVAKKKAGIAKEEDLAAFLKKSLEQVETLQKTNLMLFNQMSDHMASAEKREKLNTKLLKTIQLNMQNLDQRLKRLEEENGEEERNSTQKTEEMFMEMNGYEKRCMEDLHSVKEQLRLRQEQLSHKVGLIKDKEQELEKAGQRLHRTELEARSLEELLKHERVKNMETLEDLEAACQEAKKQLLKSESKSKNLGEKIEDMQYLYSGLQRDVASLEESIKESTCKAQNIKGIDCTLMKGKKEPRGPKEDKEAGLRGLEELKGEMRLLEKTSKTK